MPHGFILVRFLVLLSLLFASNTAVQATADIPVFKQWVEAMKTASRGPFKRIRWFCNDGEILPPEPYACVPHGGGIQHGEWSDQTRAIRAAGYPIANVLGEYARDADAANGVDRALLKAILLERFLINRDDGWIFRRARFYRGALQREDEARGESALVRRFATVLDPQTLDYLLLWEATRLLPGGGGVDVLVKLRNLATRIHESDEGFAQWRSKLHAAPTAADAQGVREYAQAQGAAELQPDYAELAATIDRLFDSKPLAQQLREAARRMQSTSLRKALRAAASRRASTMTMPMRLSDDRRLLDVLRQQLATERSGQQRETLLRAGQAIEKDAFAAASELQQQVAAATRRQRMQWLRDSAGILYGVGMLSPRQWQAVQGSVQRLQQPRISLKTYRDELRYLSRVPRWAAQMLAYHFAATVDHFADIEPLAKQFTIARLRGSLLSFYGVVLDSLQRDADRLAGVSSELFGEAVSHGLRALNAGLARGRLLQPVPGKPMAEDGIYLLPETTAALTPVAGIVTLDEGNALSHVQLLAANLGIPNVVVSNESLATLRRHLGERVVLAVSPGGVVRMMQDGPQWDRAIRAQRRARYPVATRSGQARSGFSPVHVARSVTSHRFRCDRRAKGRQSW